MSPTWHGRPMNRPYDENEEVGRALPPSRFGAGYTIGAPPNDRREEQNSPPTWGTPANAAENPPAIQYPDPPVPSLTAPGYGIPVRDPRQSRLHGGVAAAGAAAVLLLVVGAFIAGRFTAPKAGRDGAGPALSSVSPGERIRGSSGIVVEDPAGDAVAHPVDGRVYGPGDITDFSVHSDSGVLIFTTVFTPSTPMDLISVGTRIRLDADEVPTCRDSVLDSPDWDIDYDTGDVVISQWTDGCDDSAAPTRIFGSYDINGTTLTIKINQTQLGIRAGQRIVVRTCVSSRIDQEHTTFIQDWAPDSKSGKTGPV